MELNVPTNLKNELICNAFAGAFEGGSNYWLQTAELVFATNKPDPARKLVWWGHENLYEAPFTFKVQYDDPDSENGEGNGEGEKTLSFPEDVQKGLELMAQKAPRHFADLISENDDAETHDVLMQYIVLGDIVYG